MAPGSGLTSGGTSNTIWSSWCANTTLTSADYVWSNWCGSSDTATDTTATITYDEGVWTTWVRVENGRYATININSSDYNTPKLSDKEKMLQRHRREINRIEFEKDRRESLRFQRKAELTSQKLLCDLIGKNQLEVYKKTGRVFIKGNEYDYILEKEGGVRRLEKNNVVDLCIHLAEKYVYPETDNLISLKLLAEHNEGEFNKMANVISKRPPYKQLPECAYG